MRVRITEKVIELTTPEECALMTAMVQLVLQKGFSSNVCKSLNIYNEDTIKEKLFDFAHTLETNLKGE